jgi:hypothetical protein
MIFVNDIERDVLEDTVRTSGHRRQYRKELHTILHTGVAERRLQMLDLIIDITLTIANNLEVKNLERVKPGSCSPLFNS